MCLMTLTYIYSSSCRKKTQGIQYIPGVGKSVNAVAQSRGCGAPTTKALNLNIAGSKKDRDPI